MERPEFRVIIAGGRDFTDYGLLKDKCDRILSAVSTTHHIVVVSGAAKGADQLGEMYAKEKGYAVKRFPADWDNDGKTAGPIRNAKMAGYGHALIAFWDGESRGTRNMIDNARERGLQVRLVSYDAPSRVRKSNLFESLKQEQQDEPHRSQWRR